MEVGFEAAGVDVVCANEIDKTAAKTYAANYPGTELLVDDINNIFPRLSEFEGIDFYHLPQC